MTALIDRTGFEVDAIDIFCGYGGSSQGIHAAGATVRAAANHSALAIECHAANFPDTDHWQADMVDSSDPQVLDRNGKKVPGRYLDPKDLPRARFGWFSPACTHHSQANATKIYESSLQLAMSDDDDWDQQAFVNSERSRATMSCVLRYAEWNHPEILVVENVIEVTKWGPGRDGSTFRWWCTELEQLGYELEHLFLNSMFFAPCPQSRDRYYCVAVRRGNRKPDLAHRPTAFCASERCGGVLVDAVQVYKPAKRTWSLPRWGKYLTQYDYRCPACSSVVHPASWMALSAIDLTNLGPTLGERKAKGAPVAPKTNERVRRAYRKFWHGPPVLLDPDLVHALQVQVAHDDAGDRSRSIGEPTATLTNKNGQALAVAPMVIKGNGSMAEAGYRGHHASDPLGAVTAHPAQQVAFGPGEHALCLIVPNRTNNLGRHAAEPTAPAMTSATQAVVIAAAGHTFTRGEYARTRHGAEPLFTQSATAEFASAFLPVLRGDHDQDAHPSEPVDTVSAGGNHHGLATVLHSKINGGPGDTAWHGVDEPLNTITGRATTGLVLLPWVDQWRSDPALLTEQLATVTTHLRMSLAAAPPYEGEITDEMLDQVHFRMLAPDPELRRAMAFGDDYILIGTKEKMTAGLGNAVTPPVASWITERCLATLDEVAA